MEINQPAPDFSLPDLNGKLHYLDQYRGRIVILNFWSCQCPHSERTDKVMIEMAAQWRQQVKMLFVAANRNEDFEAVRNVAEARGLRTILLDADRVVADLYQAQTTPHVFVIDREGILRYRGAVDDVTFRRPLRSRFYLNEAVESLLGGSFPALSESPAYGCTIVREI